MEMHAMMRRRFFTAPAAVAAMAGLGFVKARPSLLVHEQNAFTVRVSGTADEIAKFQDAYQTHLWPDWKTHKLDTARRQVAHFQNAWANGYGLFYSGSALHRSAIAHARRVCGC